MLHHGTYEEDGSVTWEVLVFPRVIRSQRRAEKSSPNLARPQAHVPAAEFAWQDKRLSRGRPMARGTGAAVEEGEEVGGPNMSFDVGELVGNSDPAEQRGPVLM